MKFGFYNIKTEAPIMIAKNDIFRGVCQMNLQYCDDRDTKFSRILDIDNTLMAVSGIAAKTKKRASAYSIALHPV